MSRVDAGTFQLGTEEDQGEEIHQAEFRFLTEGDTMVETWWQFQEWESEDFERVIMNYDRDFDNSFVLVRCTGFPGLVFDLGEEEE